MIRIKKILCPVDFFPASDRAVGYSIALGKKYNARLVLLHVVSPIVTTGYEAPFVLADYLTALTEASEKQMQKQVLRAENAGVRAEALVRTGSIDLEIHTIIQERGIDMVVMGTHGRRGFERWLLGSVTERMLRSSNIPLLIIGQAGDPKGKAAPRNLKRILVTTDFSEGTKEALKYAFSMGEEGQAKVTLLHVIGDRATETAGSNRDFLVESSRQKLEKLIPADAVDGSEGVTVRLEDGVPAERILALLESGKYDLLVMNLHGKGFVDRALLGTTAERVIRGSASPVLLVPPRKVLKAAKKAGQKT